METNPRYLLVGSALILILLFSGGALIWLKKFGQEGKTKFYTVYFQHHSLSGLQKGSIVTMRGIPVGAVDSFQFANDDIERIKVALEVDESTPVKMDTQAVVQRNLLTGLAGIDLVNSSKNARKLDHAPEGEQYPVIQEGRGELEAIKSSLPEFVERATEVVQRVEDLLSEENRKGVSKTIANIEAMTTAVAQNKENLSDTLNDLNVVAGSVRTYVTQLEKVTTEVRDSLLPLLQGVGRSLEQMTSTVSRAAQSVDQTAQGFQNPRSILTGPSPSMLGPGESRRERK